MLVLSRRENEHILIGEEICITVLGISGRRVRLGISAPTNVLIERMELRRRKADQGVAEHPAPVIETLPAASGVEHNHGTV
jgi:carbon storage regulator